MTFKSMIIRTSSENPSDYSLRWNRWFLKPIGAWPSSPSTTRLEIIVSRFLNVICYMFILFTLVPSMFHVILADESFYMKMKTIGPVLHWFTSSINYTTLLLRQKDIRDCVDHMENDWRTVSRTKDRDVMLRNARFGQYVTFWCGLVLQSGIIYFCALSSFNRQIVEVGNETRIMYGLPCPPYSELIAIKDIHVYDALLTVQMISAIIVNSSVVGILSLTTVFAAHACGQLNVLMAWITEFVNESNRRAIGVPAKKIPTIVEHHLRILRFISSIEETMSWTCFLELFRCIMAICVLGYYTVAEWSESDFQSLTTYVVILTGMCFHSFMLCYVSDLLTEECQKVGEVVFMSNWYYLPRKKILDLMFIIARSHLIVQLTAGKLVHLSVYTFGDVMKTGFAYLNLLKQMS